MCNLLKKAMWLYATYQKKRNVIMCNVRTKESNVIMCIVQQKAMWLYATYKRKQCDCVQRIKESNVIMRKV